MIPRVAEYLKALKQQQEEDKNTFGNCYNDNDYVCRYLDGTPVNVSTFNHVFERTLEENNMLHIRFHDLRHSTASYLIKNWFRLRSAHIAVMASDLFLFASFALVILIPSASSSTLYLSNAV